MSKETKFELVPSDPETDKRLAIRKKNIRTYAEGVRKGAAQLYGYAFLAGREMLLAKEEVPHGSSGKGDGFVKWIEETFPEITVRTAHRWMDFAATVTEKTAAVPLFKGKPLALKKTFSKAEREEILKVIPQIMDGKSMTTFMRDSNLLRDPEPHKYHPPHPSDPDAKVEAEHQGTRDLVGRVMGDMNLLLATDAFAKVRKEPALLDDALALGVRWNNVIREIKGLKP